MTSDSNYSTAFQKLQDKYIAEFPNKLKAIEDSLKAQDRAMTVTIFHKLKGNGRTYGFPAVSEIASLVDRHHKKNTPNYFQWAELGLTSLKIIYPLMVKKESIVLDSIPEFLSLKGELP